MKLPGIREWFRRCIDIYGFVPPIKYVTPEEYQYAKKFESIVVGKEPGSKDICTNCGFDYNGVLKLHECNVNMKKELKNLTTK